MRILEFLVDKDKFDYKCYDTLKELVEKNESFKQIIIDGYKSGKLYGFTEDLWDKIRKQNIRNINSFEQVFKDGANIGYCTVAAKQLSYSLDFCFLCGGVLPILKGTKNCEDGSHTWIWYDNNIIDTTLMLIINEDYAKALGYIEENRYNPNLDEQYSATKSFTLDPNLKNKK